MTIEAPLPDSPHRQQQELLVKAWGQIRELKEIRTPEELKIQSKKRLKALGSVIYEIEQSIDLLSDRDHQPRYLTNLLGLMGLVSGKFPRIAPAKTAPQDLTPLLVRACSQVIGYQLDCRPNVDFEDTRNRARVYLGRCASASGARAIRLPFLQHALTFNRKKPLTHPLDQIERTPVEYNFLRKLENAAEEVLVEWGDQNMTVKPFDAVLK